MVLSANNSCPLQQPTFSDLRSSGDLSSIPGMYARRGIPGIGESRIPRFQSNDVSILGLCQVASSIVGSQKNLNLYVPRYEVGSW